MENTATMKQGDNGSELFRVIFKNWHFVVMVVGFIVSLIYSWAHFESAVKDLQQKVADTQVQSAALTANVQGILPQMSALNAKMDILIKHSGL